MKKLSFDFVHNSFTMPITEPGVMTTDVNSRISWGKKLRIIKKDQIVEILQTKGVVIC